MFPLLGLKLLIDEPNLERTRRVMVGGCRRVGKGRGCRKLVYECANICAFYCHQWRLQTRSETRTGAQAVIKMGNCCQVWSAEGGGGSCRVAGANKTTLPAMWQVCLGYPGCAASSPVCLLAKSVSATAAKGALRPRSMAQHGTWPCPDDAISAQARLVKWQTQQQQLALGTSIGTGGRSHRTRL